MVTPIDPRCGHVSGAHPITAAKVPILKVVDYGTRIECDISVENRDGVLKSKIIHRICSLDERFQKLSLLTRHPPILPPFSAILEDGSDPDAVAKSLHKFVNYGKWNKELVAELLVTLLVKLSLIEKLWAKGLCASTYEAFWLYLKHGTPKFDASVEDFIYRSQNAARAVAKVEVKSIYKCIQRTSKYISAFMDGLVEIPTLKYQLFGHAVPFQKDSETRNIIEDGNTTTLPCRDIKKEDQIKEGQKGSQSAIPSEPIATKRKWFTEGWEGLTSVSCGQSKGKWSTEGWEGVRLASWEQPKEDGGPPNSPWSKGKKWSTKGWGKAFSVNWGQPNGDGAPPDSILTKRKRSEETSSSAQWLGKSDTKSSSKSKYAPKAKWSKNAGIRLGRKLNEPFGSG